MNPIPIGTTGQHRLLVTPEVSIDFLGDENTRILSTPHMIGFMEWTCRNAVKSFLDAGWDTVGTLINVRHLAATPVGMSVTFRARVIGMDGNRLTFQVEAEDEKEKIGEGTHERFIVDVNRFATRLARKREEGQ